MAPSTEFMGAASQASARPESTKAPYRTIEQRFRIAHEYPVVFSRNVFGGDNTAIDDVIGRFGAGPFRVLAVLDAGLLEHWPGLLRDIEQASDKSETWQLAGEPLVLSGGEASKNDPAVLKLLNARAHKLGLDRHSFVMAVGGGALLDVAGYAASTIHRGLRLLRVPTTVLSQNDGGVGVKNGVNAFDSKNFLGCFAPPAAVVNDFDFLSTLSARDRAAGMAESVKVGLIRDARFFEWLEAQSDALRRFEADAVEYLVEHTARLHLDHIASSGDPFESRNARPLDFGHWIAHKLESLTHHELRHGEAVAIGMAADSCYSEATGVLEPGGGRRVVELLQALALPIYHPALELVDEDGRRRILEGLEEFRQHLGGELCVTLLRAIGVEQQVNSIDGSLVLAELERLRTWGGA